MSARCNSKSRCPSLSPQWVTRRWAPNKPEQLPWARKMYIELVYDRVDDCYDSRLSNKNKTKATKKRRYQNVWRNDVIEILAASSN